METSCPATSLPHSPTLFVALGGPCSPCISDPSMDKASVSVSLSCDGINQDLPKDFTKSQGIAKGKQTAILTLGWLGSSQRLAVPTIICMNPKGEKKETRSRTKYLLPWEVPPPKDINLNILHFRNQEKDPFSSLQKVEEVITLLPTYPPTQAQIFIQ